VGTPVVVSGVRTSAYTNTSLADSVTINASDAQFLTGAQIPVVLSGASGVCYSGGETLGQLPPSTDWSTMHDTYAMKVVDVPGFVLEGTREFDYGDGITIQGSTTQWTIRGVYFHYMRDDCIQNDWLNSGTVEDSFFDGCFVGMSARTFTSGQGDGSANVIVVRNSLFRLQPMDEGYSDPGHGGFFKWDPGGKGPQLSLHGNVYRVDEQSQHGQHSFVPAASKLKDCSNNVMIWLGTGPFPEALPSCYRLLTGAEGLQYWNEAAAAWKAAHPPRLADVAKPIVRLYAPRSAATVQGTVQLTATAVDDRDVVGVQFKLNGQPIGAEVTGEVRPTKFTLSWDSRTTGNGSYTLTATARDAAGNTQTSAGVTVTISN
jgi:hypothetical protein